MEKYFTDEPAILVSFVDMDKDEYATYSTLQEKISYLISHIANHYRYCCEDYEDFIFSIQQDYDFRRLESFVKTRYGKDIIFPKEYNGSIEDIVNINHQVIENTLEEVLDDLLDDIDSKFETVLADNSKIEIGRD
jgi:hypothetical protein